MPPLVGLALDHGDRRARIVAELDHDPDHAVARRKFKADAEPANASCVVVCSLALGAVCVTLDQQIVSHGPTVPTPRPSLGQARQRILLSPECMSTTGQVTFYVRRRLEGNSTQRIHPAPAKAIRSRPMK